MTVVASRVSIDDIRSAVLANVRRDLLDENLTWIHLPLLRLLYAQWGCRDFHDWRIAQPSDRFQGRLLREAQQFIAPLAENPGCRKIGRGSRWTNPGYCPPTPIGDYRWPHTVWMVQEIIWMHREFVEGYDWWLAPDDRSRDANPYAGDRGRSWDDGYLIGLSEHYHPGRIQKWMDSLATEARVEA